MRVGPRWLGRNLAPCPMPKGQWARKPQHLPALPSCAARRSGHLLYRRMNALPAAPRAEDPRDDRPLHGRPPRFVLCTDQEDDVDSTVRRLTRSPTLGHEVSACGTAARAQPLTHDGQKPVWVGKSRGSVHRVVRLVRLPGTLQVGDWRTSALASHRTVPRWRL